MIKELLASSIIALAPMSVKKALDPSLPLEEMSTNNIINWDIYSSTSFIGVDIVAPSVDYDGYIYLGIETSLSSNDIIDNDGLQDSQYHINIRGDEKQISIIFCSNYGTTSNKTIDMYVMHWNNDPTLNRKIGFEKFSNIVNYSTFNAKIHLSYGSAEQNKIYYSNVQYYFPNTNMTQSEINSYLNYHYEMSAFNWSTLQTQQNQITSLTNQVGDQSNTINQLIAQNTLLQGTIDGKDVLIGQLNARLENQAALNNLPTTFIGWVKLPINAMIDLFNIEVLPHFKLGYFLLLPLLFPLVSLVIKLVRGA